MKWCLHRLLVPAFAFVLVFGAASAVLAQSSAIGGELAGVAADPADQAKALAAQLDIVPSAYGISSYTLYQIPAAAFQPRQGAATYVTGIGTSWLTSTGGTSDNIMWAPVFLPEGALISYMDTYACDSNAAGPHVTVFFTGYPGVGNGGFTDFTAMDTTGSAATPCRYFAHFLALTINNNVQYGSGYHYVVNFRFNALDGTNKLKGVDIWWQRQVSPAPLTASFTDVPTSHPYFQFIEALAASGITGGCGDGTIYCPSAPLTRGQMAVFLAKALGLHWPL